MPVSARQRRANSRFPRGIQHAGLWLGLAFTAGCGNLIRLDAERVADEVALIDADIPGCHGGADAGARSALRAAGTRVGDLIDGMRLVARSQAEGTGDVAFAGGIGSNGPCGGGVLVDYAHESGITDYDVTLDAFCLDTDDGQVVLGGKMAGKETGSPSDAGPIISRFELSSAGPLIVTHGGETTQVTLTDIRTEYGVPSEFAPGFPTEQDPDRTSIGSVVAVFPSGRESFLRNVDIERVGGIDVTIRIVEGELGTEGDGFVRVQTLEDEPILGKYVDGSVSAGAIELEGKGGTVVARQNPSDPAWIALTLDGEPLSSSIDCGAGELAREDAVVALIQALPIY